MLIEAIRSLFDSKPDSDFGSKPDSEEGPTQAKPGVEPLHLAACALLLEVAYADGEFSAAERAHLEDVLERHFSLPSEAGRRLMDLAEKERRSTPDHYRFTSHLRDGYDTEQKMVLAEIMWGVVLADGEIAEHEHYLTRKISNLLHLEPGYLSAAKAAAARKNA